MPQSAGGNFLSLCGCDAERQDRNQQYELHRVSFQQVFNRLRLIPGFPGNNHRFSGCSRERVRKQPQNPRLFPGQPFFLPSILGRRMANAARAASENRTVDGAPAPPQGLDDALTRESRRRSAGEDRHAGRRGGQEVAAGDGPLAAGVPGLDAKVIGRVRPQSVQDDRVLPEQRSVGDGVLVAGRPAILHHVVRALVRGPGDGDGRVRDGANGDVGEGGRVSRDRAGRVGPKGVPLFGRVEFRAPATAAGVTAARETLSPSQYR